jgi:spoIIIJ-associated protein
VLLGRPAAPRADDKRPEPGGFGGGDPRAGIEKILRTLAEAAAIEVRASLEESEAALQIRLAGPGASFFLEQDGEVLRSLEYLLQRSFGRALAPRRLSLDCEGGRQRRDAGLQAMARELAAAVRSDGVARKTGPLNSYERRLVHVVVSEEAGLRSFSVGEGAERCVTVAPAEPGENGRG